MLREFRFLRLQEVMKITGLSRSAICAKLNPDCLRYDSNFPAPVKLVHGRRNLIAWIFGEIQRWVESFIHSER